MIRECTRNKSTSRRPSTALFDAFSRNTDGFSRHVAESIPASLEYNDLTQYEHATAVGIPDRLGELDMRSLRSANSSDCGWVSDDAYISHRLKQFGIEIAM